jgi:hypothetical protein
MELASLAASLNTHMRSFFVAASTGDERLACLREATFDVISSEEYAKSIADLKRPLEVIDGQRASERWAATLRSYASAAPIIAEYADRIE